MMKKTMKPIRLAIVGATGVVGKMFLKVLEERKVPIRSLVLFASEKSKGLSIFFQGKSVPITVLSEQTIQENPVEYALMSAGSDVSKKYAPLFVKQKTIVIDNSSAFRMDPEVPLVVPEVNPEDIKYHKGIIANPNCSTIQAVVAIKPLDLAYDLDRMVISTYQAVSGAGSAGIEDLTHTSGSLKKFPFPIQGNVIPHIDVFLDNGNTKEEEKIIEESRKILHRPDLKIASTAVRVPVHIGHSESINLSFKRPFEMNSLISLLKKSPSIIVYERDGSIPYPMPLLVEGKDEVFVGRIRRDASIANGLNMFVVADNIRKGAATNAVQILILVASKNI
jgi:aspartate-semialdehyde dehydrogenase